MVTKQTLNGLLTLQKVISLCDTRWGVRHKGPCAYQAVNSMRAGLSLMLRFPTWLSTGCATL